MLTWQQWCGRRRVFAGIFNTKPRFRLKNNLIKLTWTCTYALKIVKKILFIKDKLNKSKALLLTLWLNENFLIFVIIFCVNHTSRFKFSQSHFLITTCCSPTCACLLNPSSVGWSRGKQLSARGRIRMQTKEFLMTTNRWKTSLKAITLTPPHFKWISKQSCEIAPRTNFLAAEQWEVWRN